MLAIHFYINPWLLKKVWENISFFWRTWVMKMNYHLPMCAVQDCSVIIWNSDPKDSNTLSPLWKACHGRYSLAVLFVIPAELEHWAAAVPPLWKSSQFSPTQVYSWNHENAWSTFTCGFLVKALFSYFFHASSVIFSSVVLYILRQ